MWLISSLLDNPYVQTLIVGGVGWVVNKAFGKRADSKAR